MTFPEIDAAAQTPAGQTRLKRQLAEQAIAHATAARWADAAETNRRLLELAPDSEAENRLAKALWEQGELGAAREHYQKALALDPTNRIAERNIDRLKVLLVEAGEKTVAREARVARPPSASSWRRPARPGSPTSRTSRAPRELAQVNPGDAVELIPEGNRLIAFSNGIRIGVVEPRVAARLLKLLADGNKYLAGVTSLGDKDVRLIIREVFQDPRNYGKVSFPTAAKSTDLRPYTKGTLVREDEDLEDDLEDDIEDEEIENLDRVLPPEETTDEAFVEETDELDEAIAAPPVPAPGLARPRRVPLGRRLRQSPRWLAARCSCARNRGSASRRIERFAPPPSPALVAARLEAASSPGDIVLDLFGRGGWIARSAIDRQRKAVTLEIDAAGPPPRRGRPPPARPAPPRRGRPGDRRVCPPRVQPQGLDHATATRAGARPATGRSSSTRSPGRSRPRTRTAS